MATTPRPTPAHSHPETTRPELAISPDSYNSHLPCLPGPGRAQGVQLGELLGVLLGELAAQPVPHTLAGKKYSPRSRSVEGREWGGAAQGSYYPVIEDCERGGPEKWVERRLALLAATAVEFSPRSFLFCLFEWDSGRNLLT